MGHVTGPPSRSGCCSTHSRRSTTTIIKPNANRSMEWKLKSGGWKSISINFAKKSRDGATINGCSSRKELLTAHAGTPLPGIRVVGYAVEDVAILRFRAELRKSSCTESGSPSRGTRFLCIPNREPGRAQMMDRDALSLAKGQ